MRQVMALVALCFILLLVIHTSTGLLHGVPSAAIHAMLASYDRFVYNHFIVPYGRGGTVTLMFLVAFVIAYGALRQKEVTPQQDRRPRK